MTLILAVFFEQGSNESKMVMGFIRVNNYDLAR